MAKKKRVIVWYGRIYFHDEAVRIGCGARGIELIKLGWKWALIRERSTGIASRLNRKVWDQLYEHSLNTYGEIQPKRRRNRNVPGERRESGDRSQEVRSPSAEMEALPGQTESGLGNDG